ncbi:hypothetical protein G6011_03126 [Alternaria panax]|uniref:Uncharacterized protein n=1 Tax=Alternaria panax TaxID=48097 RepID=A0AAD4IE52_9PLEO|nr:hypothetical protein G6011_03126 [Alternaria panax]
MDCTKVSSQPWGIHATSGIFPTSETHTWPFAISKLQSEKKILEDGLANCVTYLQVLRKKQARTERRLGTDPSLPRKKKKKIQQGKRELEKEIKCREQDEQAFLNNLQACKANIYIAETISLPSTAISSTIPDIASISTRCSYPEDVQTEPTEMSWNGWTDETVLSPFQKESNSSFLADDVAPDAHSKIGHTGGMIVGNSRQSLAVQDFEADDTSPNIQTHASLSAEAAVFHPRSIHTGQSDAIDQQLTQLHLSSSMAITTLKIKALELLERRLFSDAGIIPARRRSSLANIDEEAVIRAEVYSTQQRSNKFIIARNLKVRTSSL